MIRPSVPWIGLTVTLALAGCQTTETRPVTLEEAKAPTSTFVATRPAPPRNVTDVTTILDTRGATQSVVVTKSRALADSDYPERDVVLGRRATEGTVESRDLTPYRVAAIATHGLVPGDLDGLNEPALALTSPAIGLSRSEALRQAMLGLMDGAGFTDDSGRTISSYAHPIFWAPFSLVGDGGGG